MKEALETSHSLSDFLKYDKKMAICKLETHPQQNLVALAP